MKPLLIVSLLATIGTAVLGFMNLGKYKELREAKDQDAKATRTTLDDTKKIIEGDINPTIASWQGEKKRYNADSFARDSQKKEAASLTKSTEETVAKKEAVQKEIDTMVANFNEALKGLGITDPAELAAKRDAMKAEVTAQNEEIAKADQEITVLNGVLAENDKQTARMNDLQTQRTKGIALGSRAGTVAAVNPDYGFVIVNMGKEQGVTNDSKLLVCRGQELVGRLKITQIEGYLTVADIDQKSLKGGTVLPGDQVIFNNEN